MLVDSLSGFGLGLGGFEKSAEEDWGGFGPSCLEGLELGLSGFGLGLGGFDHLTGIGVGLDGFDHV